MMGTPYDEIGCGETSSIYRYETYHPVKISKFFYIGKYEVTQSQYEKIMGNNPSKFKDAQMPVGYISWKDAKTFCDTLNTKYSNQLPEGYRFDLPTEAQWEYACRAGTTTSLNNGTNIKDTSSKSSNLDEIAWYDGNSNDTTQKVGQKKANAWGIYDMHGNVQEWCRNLYDDYSDKDVVNTYEKKQNPDEDHVQRGGGFQSFAMHCRSAYRHEQGAMSTDAGFRVALVWDGKTPISDSSSNSSVKEAPKAETSSSNSSSTTQQKNSASYDTKEYKPIQLKPIKTHPKVVVPEELELEP